jgi:hypothetical protein
MTEAKEGRRNPRTGLKTGHYKGEEKSGPPQAFAVLWVKRRALERQEGSPPFRAMR